MNILRDERSEIGVVFWLRLFPTPGGYALGYAAKWSR